MTNEVLCIGYSSVRFCKSSARNHEKQCVFFYGNECWWDKIWYNHKHFFSKKCPLDTTNYNFFNYLEGRVIPLSSDTLALSNDFKLIRSVLRFPAKLVNSFLKLSLFRIDITVFNSLALVKKKKKSLCFSVVY